MSSPASNLPNIPSRPLPEQIADWLRNAMGHITNPSTRGELVSIAEAAYAAGYESAYDRGYRDGMSESEMAHRVLAIQRPLDPPYGQSQNPATTMLPPPHPPHQENPQ